MPKATAPPACSDARSDGERLTRAAEAEQRCWPPTRASGAWTTRPPADRAGFPAARPEELLRATDASGTEALLLSSLSEAASLAWAISLSSTGTLTNLKSFLLEPVNLKACFRSPPTGMRERVPE